MVVIENSENEKTKSIEKHLSKVKNCFISNFYLLFLHI
jgi:hypothetical protein